MMAQLYGPGPADAPPLVPTGDLAGLRTHDVEDRPVGALFGALSEQPTGLIRYLDVELDGPEKHVLVPIGHARIDTGGVEPRVRLRAATFEDLLAVPEYRPDRTEVDAGYHERLLEAYGRVFYGAHYYAHPSFDHDTVFGGAGQVDAVSTTGPADGDGVGAGAAATVQPMSRLPERGAARIGRNLLGRRVVDSRGEAVGEVTDLLVETRSHAPRYALIDLTQPPRSTAVPLGFLDARADGEELIVRALTADEVRLLPPCEGSLTRQQENRIRTFIEGRLSGERTFQRPDFRPGPITAAGR
jgi:hypothetical protein